METLFEKLIFLYEFLTFLSLFAFEKIFFAS